MRLSTIIYIVVCTAFPYVGGQTQPNPTNTDPSIPPDVTIPPVAEMRGGPSDAFTDYLTVEGGTTKWKGSHSSYINEYTKTKSSVGGPQETPLAQRQITIKINMNVAGGSDLWVLTSPLFRNSITNIYQKITKCVLGNLKTSGHAELCGFNAFLQQMKNWEFLGDVSEYAALADSLPGSFNTELIAASFGSALKNSELPLDFGHLTPTAYSFAWISWFILLNGQPFPEILRIPSYLRSTLLMENEREKTTCSIPPGDPRTPICLADDCKAFPGGECTVGTYKGCECIALALSYPKMMNMQWMELQESIHKPPIICAPNKMGGIDAASFKKAINHFCKLTPGDITVNRELKFTGQDIALNRYASEHFWFTFFEQPGLCSQNCVDLYGSFLEEDACYDETKGLAFSGAFTQACGMAMFYIGAIDTTVSVSSTMVLSPSSTSAKANLLSSTSSSSSSSSSSSTTKATSILSPTSTTTGAASSMT